LGDATYNPLLDEEFNQRDGESGISQQIKKGLLGTALMNCAVDEALARSIYDTICEGKTGKHLDPLSFGLLGLMSLATALG
jgi:hypothetical protein